MAAKSVLKLNILVVDDEPLIRETVTMLLESDGHQVDTASSGASALAAFAPGKFDLVFTDYFMPAMNGGQLAAAMKALSPSQPIVMLTAFPEKLQGRDQRVILVDFVLGKPFDVEELRAAVTRFPALSLSPAKHLR